MRGSLSDSTDVEFLRRQRGITQQQLAALADCSLRMIKLLESGYEPTRSKVYPRVLAALVALNDVEPGRQPGRRKAGRS